ncbi:beta-ketoacyl-ACP synthase [Spartinivicinus poritis]|uniref:Beta-ketoacyl-ACP synthase n=1 Tax=Spartinivicinus poritis TaxID=2994640 RepID=A0ABT5U485_9GAMM|nr:beta-ketoacyl-ACP synthase [Spartinivicinus sp. A2-2]MDE1460347.1 beta-ketoacyl-ACP synthase [Spartinivicinus sp. A2-2]
MLMRRVVVTGMSCITGIGQSWEQVQANLKAKQSSITRMEDWERFEGMHTRLAGPVPDFSAPSHYSRKKIRSMGRVSLMATRATELALENAGLLDDPRIRLGSMGVAYGSSVGSTEPLGAFGSMITEGSCKGVTATSYIQMMSHTAAVNIGLFFGLTGRLIPTSSACTSGSQAIGFAYEAIKYGMQDMMVAGGAEELCPTEAMVFDTLFATSTKNDTPELTPRPFDKARDGLVIGEGAGTLILEELEHAIARGAPIYAEIVGFGSNTDGAHVTQPNAETMAIAMELALKDAELAPEAIGYVSAHGTATDRGDIAETQATEQVYGNIMPISSQKSYLGHTLGACGAIEAWLSIEMMNNNWFAPTINLTEVDDQCGELDYIMGEGRELNCEYITSNNFAFGGVNTSLIFKRWD